MDIRRDAELMALADRLREHRYLVSDLILEQDGRTLQFVDLVMEGGGTLGIALVGYIYAMEQAGIRFLRMGGSSVGAIVSLLLACSGPPAAEKGERLAALIADMDMASFIDGGGVCAALSRLLGSGRVGQKKRRAALLALLSLRTLHRTLGLNPGDRFLAWLTQCLSEFGVHSLKDAQRVLGDVPAGLTHRLHGRDFFRPSPALKLVAADLTTSSKVVFPDMAALYWEEPETVNPALFARASMSIPGFFQPMEVSGVAQIVNHSENWRDLCSFSGAVPDRITFSDGGLLSNFPISLFHVEGIPCAPTFGVRLGSATRVVREIHSIGAYGGALFSALRHYSDYDFIYQNPDYRKLITHIPTEAHNWLDFSMPEEETLLLFKKGALAAYDFLERFDWPAYKELRRAKHTARY